MGTKIFGLIRNSWSSKKRDSVSKPRTFDGYVTSGILANNEFGISEVIGLNSIKSMYFKKDKYSFIVDLIRGKQPDELIKIPKGNIHPTFKEYLVAMQFKDQSGENFIVTVYDSIELWQNLLFVDTAYTFLGFIEHEDSILAVLIQPFIDTVFYTVSE